MSQDPPPKATFQGWTTEHSVHVSGKRGSYAASDGSRAPLGIRKEIGYTVADASCNDFERFGSSESHELTQPPVVFQPPNIGHAR
jgi:hypothetical protein